MALDYGVIGERIKKARLDKSLTQEVLAEKLGVSVAFLSKVERGHTHISLPRLNQICNLLEVQEGTILNDASRTAPGYLSKDFELLFQKCTPRNIKLIYEITKIIANQSF